jgi:hypothetical protein
MLGGSQHDRLNTKVLLIFQDGTGPEDISAEMRFVMIKYVENFHCQ